MAICIITQYGAVAWSAYLLQLYDISVIDKTIEDIGSIRGSPNGTIGNFTNGIIGSQLYHWLTNGTIGLILAPIVPLGEPIVLLALQLVQMVLPLVPLVKP